MECVQYGDTADTAYNLSSACYLYTPIKVNLCFGLQDQALAGKEAMAGQLEITKVKYEEAVELRRRAEMEIEAFRPVRGCLITI